MHYGCPRGGQERLESKRDGEECVYKALLWEIQVTSSGSQCETAELQRPICRGAEDGLQRLKQMEQEAALGEAGEEA